MRKSETREGTVDKIINLLVSVNEKYFRRGLFVVLPALTVLLSIYNIITSVPYGLFFAGNVTVLLVAILVSIIYYSSSKSDLFCMIAMINFLLSSITSFLAYHVNLFLFFLMCAVITILFVITILVRFSPRRYG